MVGISQHLFEKQTSLVDAMGPRQALDIPERAGREASFSAPQTFQAFVASISEHKGVYYELTRNGIQSRQPLPVRGTDKAYKRHQQRGRVQRIAPLVLNERTQLLIPKVRIDIFRDGIACLLHPIERSFKRALLSQSDGSVECDPAHK